MANIPAASYAAGVTAWQKRFEQRAKPLVQDEQPKRRWHPKKNRSVRLLDF